ncbi:hypothetical protein BKA62DRAFT_631828 [Auriculariales sp. MPI-PUGE-AT-0066]|nr:hypothetical protein BKA62DRAFT_631828 [Auriculariales sp. MPI-PUGE-AT-0066]
MSTEEAATTSGAPRRSGRERKQFAPIPLASDQQSKKRKRGDGDEELDEELEEDGERDEEDADDDEAVDDEPTPKRKRAAVGGASRKKAVTTAGDTPEKRKPVAARAKVGAPARKGRKAGVGADGAAFSLAHVAQTTRISTDNALFNAILNPATALQSTAEDFLDSYSQSKDLALAELVNLVLRSAGCNASVDQDEAADEDGVVSKADDIAAELLNKIALPYPLISKLAVFKKFHKSLAEFLHRLVAAAFETGVLLDDSLFHPFPQWVISMASASLRSFRHTATVVALELQTALSEVASAADKEAETLVRQRDTEKKKKTGRSAAREKELEQKSKKANETRAKIKALMKDIHEGVFVHRFRDHHSEIRAECARALGTWLKVYPSHFLDGAYLRYVGWLLSDTNHHARLEAVRSLVALYSKEDYIITLRNFTERFKGRLLEMAVGDADMAIRVASIQVLSIIDQHALLEDEQRERLCVLVFDTDARVRKAISVFVKGIWNEDVESRMSGHKTTDKIKSRAGVKALAALLVSWQASVPKPGRRSGGGDGDDDTGDDAGSETHPPSKNVAVLVQPLQKGRLAFAVDGLYDEIEAMSDWEALLELLLLDHSAEGDNGSGTAPRRKKNAKAVEETVEAAWRLDEAEEGVILEVFVASLRKAIADSKKNEGDSVQTDITRTLINTFPRLFAKYQADERRICSILIIPQQLSLDLFLEMRMVSAYETLWDDVNKQFLTTSNPSVLSHAMDTIRHLQSATSLSNTNSLKILELEDELSSSLRDTVAGRDELEITTFSDDEVHALTAIAMRINALFGFRDMTSWMEEDEGGKQSNAWDILSAIAERGGLGYKEEDQLVEQCLQVLYRHIVWKARRFVGNSFAGDEHVRQLFKEQRDNFLAKVTEFTIGNVSKSCENVARASFQHMLSLHVLFGQTAQAHSTDASDLVLVMDDEKQYRCAGFVQSEIEKFAEEIREERESQEEEPAGSEAGSGSETEAPSKNKKGRDADKDKAATGKNRNSFLTLSQARLEREYSTAQVLSVFLSAVTVRAIDIKHAPILLAYYGTLGTSFDLIARRVVETLRQEGLDRQQGENVATVATQALKDAFNLYLDDTVRSESHAAALSKALLPAFIKRGVQLHIIARLPREHLVAVHTRSISWIVKLVQTHENNKNAKSKRKALTFFKVLAPLVAAAESRDALSIKTHLDQAFSLAQIDPGMSNEWEPLRAYERRLAGKDKTIGLSTKPRRGKAAKPDGATTDEDGMDDLIEDPDAEKPQRPARKRAPRKSKVSRKSGTDDDDDFAGRDGITEESAPRRRSARGVNGKSAASESEPEDGAEQIVIDEEEEPARVNGKHTTPRTSLIKKRRRPDDEEEEEEEEESTAPAADAPKELSEYKIRRKRARAAL